MKRSLLISLLPFIFTAVTLQAQYVYPPQQKIYTYTDTTYTTKDSIYISASLPQFKINNLILGWHWGGSYKISKSLCYWDASRYFNKLVGGLAITEGNSQDERYIYTGQVRTEIGGVGKSGI